MGTRWCNPLVTGLLLTTLIVGGCAKSNAGKVTIVITGIPRSTCEDYYNLATNFRPYKGDSYTYTCTINNSSCTCKLRLGQIEAKALNTTGVIIK